MIWMDVDVALAEVPVNICPLVSSTDFKTVDEGVTYDEAGMELYWHFVTTAGATSVTAVTPTTGGAHDWAHQDHGMYTIEIPDTGGTVDNDTEGFGYFTGKCTATLAWRGPTIGFRAAALNNALIDGGDVLDVNLAEILGTALTETSGLLAGGFKKFFNVASPTGTLNSMPDAVPGAAGGTFIAGSNAATTLATLTVSGATTLTGNVALGGTLAVAGTTTLTGAVVLSSTLTTGAATFASATVTGALTTGSIVNSGVFTQTGNVSLGGTYTVSGVSTYTGAVTYTGGIVADITGDLSGSVGSIGTGGITAASIADAAIDNATFAADVGSTVYASNIIALAVNKAIANYDPPTKAEMDTGHGLLATPAQVATALTTYDGPTKAEMDTAHALLATPAQVLTQVGSGLATYDPPTKAEMDTAHALLATPAQVNAQVLDVMATDTITLPGQAALSVTPTIVTALGWLYKLARNKGTETSTEHKVYADDDTTVDQKATVSDDATTAVHGKFGSGA